MGAAGAVGWAVVAGLAACEDPSIREYRVAKGVEPAWRVEDSQPAGVAGPAESEGAGEGAGAEDGAAAAAGHLPAGWSRVDVERPMRLATFAVEDPQGHGGPLEVAVSRFPGDVGGALANVNRWRGQMGLAAVDADGLAAVIERTDAGYAARVDGAEATMLAVAAYEAGADRTWFVRVVADPAAVSRVAASVKAYAARLPEGGAP